jgi:hypothetical protein
MLRGGSKPVRYPRRHYALPYTSIGISIEANAWSSLGQLLIYDYGLNNALEHL